MRMNEHLLETWDISNRVTLYMLDAVPDDVLGAKLNGRGRSVGEQFAHLHNVRLMWLQSADPALMDIGKIEKQAATDRDILTAGLRGSAQAIRRLLENAFAKDGKIRGFKPHATAFAGYLIAHEAHHRGQIALTMKIEGVPLDKKTSFGLWEWGVR